MDPARHFTARKDGHAHRPRWNDDPRPGRGGRRRFAQVFIASPWDGFYIGGNLGAGGTDFDITDETFHGNGVVGGFQVGYNKEFGNFVLGVESDFDLSSIDTSVGSATIKLPWFGTTRGRAGYLINPSLLLYGTGGVAYGRMDISSGGSFTNFGGVGWAAGAGIEYAFTPAWTIGAEYLHVELDHFNSSSSDFRTNTDLGRAKINYRF
jgi:outer membrane immunogenic protein